MHNYVVACVLHYEDSPPRPYHSSTPAKVSPCLPFDYVPSHYNICFDPYLLSSVINRKGMLLVHPAIKRTFLSACA